MRIVAALGGNALLRRGQRPGAAVQMANVRAAAQALAPVAREHELIVTHGNGPQVGLLALQSEAAGEAGRYPLDLLGAQTQGMIGYMIEDELRDALGGAREVATLLTEVVVDARDPAFGRPTKPVGPGYDEAEARRLARERGWAVGPDGGRWRRVVASPEPLRIVEIRAIRLLVGAGVVVVCAGGGGVPVVRDEEGGLRGVEAVVDKDLSAALLAAELGADALVMLTDADAVYDHWGTPSARRIDRASPRMLRGRSFPAGSMAPKVEAACRFVEGAGNRTPLFIPTDRVAGRRFAAIGAMSDVGAVVRGEKGTRIEADA
jgi:carbamate kinase